MAKYAPWKQPWWRVAPGDGPTLFWMILLHVGAIAGLILTPLPGWKILAAAAALHFMGGLGTTVCFHRALAHKSVKLHPVVRNMLTFFAMLNGSGSPLSWAANHRLHHAKSDTPEDVSSPRIGGFWWSHLRWLWQAGAAPVDQVLPGSRQARVPFWNPAADPDHRAVGSCSAACPSGWRRSSGWARSAWCSRCTRSASSTASATCARTQPTGEATAQNLRWLALMHFFQGENWHQNHHDRPGSARLGWRSAQVDFGWYTIVLLEKLGLATDVRRPTVEESLEAAA